MVSALGAFAKPGGLQLRLSQFHSGARGRGKNTPGPAQSGVSNRTHQRTIPSVFGKSRQLRTTNVVVGLDPGAK